MKKLTALLLLLPVLAAADPGTATKYLISDQASLMDIGLLRAEIYLNEIAEAISSEESEVTARTLYDFGNDLIIFLGVVNTPTNPKEQCTKFLLYPMLRAEISISVNGVPYGQHDFGGHERVAAFFTHAGFARTSEPDDFKQNVLERIEVTCVANETIGRRKLLADNIYWTEGNDE